MTSIGKHPTTLIYTMRNVIEGPANVTMMMQSDGGSLSEPHYDWIR
jgi:hypothetical protein